ncbi:hypothetical protein HDU96_005345 [Phlyctochytrium bullatum]|nr:hypothetical protein HDU96_005345 [Phlyctochytrium bullatum]
MPSIVSFVWTAILLGSWMAGCHGQSTSAASVSVTAGDVPTTTAAVATTTATTPANPVATVLTQLPKLPSCLLTCLKSGTDATLDFSTLPSPDSPEAATAARAACQQLVKVLDPQASAPVAQCVLSSLACLAQQSQITSTVASVSSSCQQLLVGNVFSTVAFDPKNPLGIITTGLAAIQTGLATVLNPTPTNEASTATTPTRVSTTLTSSASMQAGRSGVLTVLQAAGVILAAAGGASWLVL